MICIENKAMCSGCSACSAVCPKQCITMEKDDEGFLYPCVDEQICIHCKVCTNTCPFLNGSEQQKLNKVYGFNLKNEMVRIKSSSGGVFTIVAEKIISKGGIVFGVVLTEDCRSAKYLAARKIEDLSRMRGSKYIQAEVGNAYKQVKKYLLNNKWVLFTGVPCQINGLKNYLKDDFDRLICVDIICHGVPSGKLWSHYMEYDETANGKKIVSINFRCKQKGWNNFGIEKSYDDGSKSFESMQENSYMSIFLHNFSLRESCYACKAKNQNRSDLTIGDFWGIQEVIPELYDDKGSSLVIVRTEKGAKLFDCIRGDGSYKEVSYKNAVLYNSAEYKSVKRPKQRENFYINLSKYNYDKMKKMYCKESLTVKTKKLLKRTLVWKVYKNIIRGKNE